MTTTGVIIVIVGIIGIIIGVSLMISGFIQLQSSKSIIEAKQEQIDVLTEINQRLLEDVRKYKSMLLNKPTHDVAKHKI